MAALSERIDSQIQRRRDREQAAALRRDEQQAAQAALEYRHSQESRGLAPLQLGLILRHLEEVPDEEEPAE